MKSSLNKELDGFQSEIDQKLDILQESISMLTNLFVHQKEENLEEECLTDTIVGEQAQFLVTVVVFTVSHIYSTECHLHIQKLYNYN